VIKELKDKFLEKNPAYTNDVNNFVNYIGEESFNNEFILGGMTTKGILDSLISYVNSGQIQKKEPAKKYTSAIGQLFEYILENSNIKNIGLSNQLGAPPKRKNSYLGQCTNFIINCKELQEKESYNALDDETVYKLIEWCDRIIVKMESEKVNQNIGFKHMAAALCIKLMLLTGITYRVVRSIKFSSLNTELNTLVINNYKLRLPLVLSKQFKLYKKICLERNFDLENGYLFIGINGKQWNTGTSSSGIPTYLQTEIKQTDITGIIKYGIKQLMLQDVNSSVIIRLTGVSNEIMEDCLPKSEADESDWYSYINSKIVKSRLYDKL